MHCGLAGLGLFWVKCRLMKRVMLYSIGLLNSKYFLWRICDLQYFANHDHALMRQNASDSGDLQPFSKASGAIASSFVNFSFLRKKQDRWIKTHKHAYTPKVRATAVVGPLPGIIYQSNPLPSKGFFKDRALSYQEHAWIHNYFYLLE